MYEVNQIWFPQKINGKKRKKREQKPYIHRNLKKNNNQM